MSKIMNKLAVLFGRPALPIAGLNAQLMMDSVLIARALQCQNNVSIGYDITKGRYHLNDWQANTCRKRYVQQGMFCYVVKVGFKQSVVRVCGHEIVVPTNQIKQAS